MAGRGAIIHIKVLGCTSSITSANNSSNQEKTEDDSEDLALPVALHTPLSLLQTEIESLTDIVSIQYKLINNS